MDRVGAPAYTTSMADQPDDPDMSPGSGEPRGGLVTSEPLDRALGERYLTYALSTIMHRALPDARDGLKPVHRRILYAMRGLRLDPNGAFRKCAKIVGEVMGTYHPHGDQAIYDALARLAQDFNVRYPLVDGQGNFGNIDGDNPAAQRYTEARMTAAAAALLEGLSEDAVDFRDNYDGSEQEPVVLPAAFPNLLANGSSGIAVGMATNIPPHNIDELVNACLHLVKHPGASDEKLLDFVQGPDFPTGGVIVEPRANIKEAYRTGRGSFRVRARWAVEDLGRGTWQIVVTEIPYQVQKGKLIERLAELINAEEDPDPRRRARRERRGRPRRARAAGAHRRAAGDDGDAVPRERPRDPLRDEHERADRRPHPAGLDAEGGAARLPRPPPRGAAAPLALPAGKIDARLEVLEGLLVAYLNLDRVIEIIRYEDEPKAVLIAEFSLSDVQAEAILNMRLRNLRQLEEMEIRAERDALTIEREGLAALLADEERAVEPHRRGAARGPQGLRQGLPPAARGAPPSTTSPDVEEVSFEAMIEREPITVVCSEMGWIRAMKGHLAADAELKFKDGDGPRFLLHAETTDRLVLFASNGRMYTLACANLPGRAGHGRAGAADDRPAERGAGAGALRPQAGGRLLVASEAGDGFVLPEDEGIAQTRGGRQILNLREGARARVLPAACRATMSRRSARTARCWSFRSRSCQRWGAARACACSATRTAGCRTRSPSTWPTASSGRIRPGGRGSSPTSGSG